LSPVVERLRKMIWVELPVDLVLFEEAVLGVKDFVAQLCDKLFEEATPIDAFLSLSMLVYKLNLQWTLKVYFIHEYSIKGILENVRPVYCHGVESSIALSLLLDQMLENLCTQLKRYGVWNADQNCVTHCIRQLHMCKLIKAFLDVFLYDPEVLPIYAKALVSVVES